MGSVFVFGATAEPEVWTKRLQAVRTVKIKDNPKDKLTALHIHCVASGTYAEMKESASSSSLAQIAELQNCA